MVKKVPHHWRSLAHDRNSNVNNITNNPWSQTTENKITTQCWSLNDHVIANIDISTRLYVCDDPVQVEGQVLEAVGRGVWIHEHQRVRRRLKHVNVIRRLT